MKAKIAKAIIYLVSLQPFSCIRVLTYRLLGMHIGKNIYIGIGTLICAENLNSIKIGNNVTIGNNVKLMAKKGLFIDDESIIQDNTVVAGKEKIIIGSASYIGRSMFIDTTAEVKIGNKVFISFSKIFTHNYSYSVFVKGRPITSSPVRIGSKTWIGPEAFICPGVIIAPNSYIGPKSLVSTNTKPFVFYAGAPARAVEDISTKILKFKKEVNIFKEIAKIVDAREIDIKLLKSITENQLSKLIKAKSKKQKLLVIGYMPNNTITKVLNMILKEKNIFVFDLAKSIYFPQKFNRNSLIWDIKTNLRSIGIFLKPYKKDKND